MEIDPYLLNILSVYQLPAIFLGAFFFGETVIITASFLAAEGLWSLTNVFWLSLLGTIISDVLWFSIGQHILRITKRWENYREKSNFVIAKVEHIFGDKLFLILLFIKFLYGTRILTIIYLSVRRVRFSTFLLFDTIGSCIWLAAMISIGWFAGRGIINLIPVVDTFQYALLFLIILLISFKLVTTWISKKIIK